MHQGISVENLSKSYPAPRGGAPAAYRTLREELALAASAPFRRLRRKHPVEDSCLWALKDVDFRARPGEVVGVIGRNGAGKSTLLKILGRITRPTSGKVAIRGRVGSLLEVGTGFHPELTGRENIYLNGAILGMHRREIRRKFDEIVAFAETERFLDFPVKQYSSGMYMRLAFAVAAHLDPEILLIDEVLAVGDVAFQKKCIGKMSGLATSGRTILFVSHNLPAVKGLCRAAILLDGGRIVKAGPAAETVDFFLGEQAAGESEYRWPPENGPGDERARLLAVRILDERGLPTTCFRLNEPVFIDVEYLALKPETPLSLSISLHTADEVHVLASPSTSDSDWYLKPHPPGRYRSRCVVPARLLNAGRYFFSLFLVENAVNVIAALNRFAALELVDDGQERGGFMGAWQGVVRPDLTWKTESLPATKE
jgi:lipopolysaccharide transport system ATP-binding protein